MNKKEKMSSDEFNACMDSIHKIWANLIRLGEAYKNHLEFHRKEAEREVDDQLTKDMEGGG